MKSKSTIPARTYSPFINNIPIRHGEITVITSRNAVASMKHSSRLASDTKKTGLGTLLINCSMSNNRFQEFFLEHYDPCVKKPELVIHSSVQGNLIGEREAIDQIITQAKISVIIIAGWEWTSSSWRRKERLFFYLRELMAEYNIAIVIYSHVFNSPVAGEIDRAGLGKLSLLAMFVVELGASEVLEEIIRKPPPIVINTVEEEREAERSARLLINKINGLGGEGGSSEG